MGISESKMREIVAEGQEQAIKQISGSHKINSLIALPYLDDPGKTQQDLTMDEQVQISIKVNFVVISLKWS
jgi:hypothetical protein